MAAKTPQNWLSKMLPFPRPEYAQQTESLLIDLVWNSKGSTLSEQELLAKLAKAIAPTGRTSPDPRRLVFASRPGHSVGNKSIETFSLAEEADISQLISSRSGVKPTRAVLTSLVAPRARGGKSDACVPVHPALTSLQTLNGLVNKANPPDLAKAIEIMGLLGGSGAEGEVAVSYIKAFQGLPGPKEGTTGLLASLSEIIAGGVWDSLQARTPGSPVEKWPGVGSLNPEPEQAALSIYSGTPFTWFWSKWSCLTDPSAGWYMKLPARRFVDWALCLVRTGLAFSYLWEARFYTQLQGQIADRRWGIRRRGEGPDVRSMLTDKTILATFEPLSVPARQKNIWPGTKELLARGHVARDRLLSFPREDAPDPPGMTAAEMLDAWVQGLTNDDIVELGEPLKTQRNTAANQQEFVRYLLLPRSSDDDLSDQADFYYLARTNGASTWFQPGPEWLVVITSLLCGKTGGECTLGELVEDLNCLGIRVDRSVLVGLLEEAGLSTDSPDADNALVIKSGF